MAITLTDNSADLNGLAINTDHEAKTALTLAAEKSGFTSLVSEKGIFPNATRLMREIEASEDYRLRVGMDSLWFTDQAIGTVINTSIWTSPTSTMTVTLANNAYIFNAGNSVTANHYAIHKTWRTFPMAYKGSAVYGECTMMYTAQPLTNHSFEGGFFNCATTADPTDGVFFRVRDGNLYCVACNNSVEQTVNLGTAPAFGVEHNLVIEVTPISALFWMDNELVAKIENSASTFSIQSQSQLPFQIRQFNGSTAPAYALQIRVSNISVSMADLDNNRLWPTCKAGMGGGCYQVPSGATAGQSANWTNSAAVAMTAAASLVNTTAAFTGLGGQFFVGAPAAADTDLNIMKYLVPANNTLVIRGVRVDCANMVVAVATTAHLLQWGVAIGSTADTLAGTESATVKIRRAVPLGLQYFPVASPVGYAANALDINFDAPIVVHGGEYVSFFFKVLVGTATSTQGFRGTIMVNGYFE